MKSKYNSTQCVNILVNIHTIGKIRDLADLYNCKYHARQTINFIEKIILKMDGTDEEKLDFIVKIKQELEKIGTDE
jgi:hypothetical protein